MSPWRSGCAALAAALAAEGLESTLPRAEAAGSLEGLVLVAGLRLWTDPHDSLATATIAQLIERADGPDAWLAETLGAPGAEAFDALPSVSCVRAAREASPLLGPEAAFDAVLDALDLRGLCLSWGAAASRLASLEELRANAAAFTGRALSEGRPATVLGFLDSLDEAVKPEQRPESPDTVVVSTLHRAKGLEWPIVVLDLQPDTREPSVFGVNVLSEAPIDLERPLAGRRIAFWPAPYSAKTSRTRPARLARPRFPPVSASTRSLSSPPRRWRRRAPRASRSPSVRAFPCAPVPTYSSSETLSTAFSPRTVHLSPDPTGLALADALIARWGVSGALPPGSFLDASDSFAAFVASRWPDATWHRELPLRRRLPDGSVLSGTADLVLETPDGLVVIDHKSFPASTEQALARAATHAGQLAAYAQTVGKAWGKAVLGTFIHLPVGGIVVPVMPAP